MLSNSVCIKSVTFDHIIQNEEGARFVVQRFTAETQTKQKCHNVFGVHFIVTVFENKCIFKLQYKRECRRGKEVKNICLFSSFNFYLIVPRKTFRLLVVDNISLITIFIDLSNGDLAVGDEICLGNRISISSREHSALRWRLLNHQH